MSGWRDLDPDDLYPVRVVTVPAARSNCACGTRKGYRCGFCKEVLMPLPPGKHRPSGIKTARRVTHPSALPGVRAGQRVVLTDHVRDGEVLTSREALFIGTGGRPDPTPAEVLEHARAVAVWTVRDGMRDVLRWLRQPLPPKSAPQLLTGKGHALHARLSRRTYPA
ncbi:MAG: hypothetical protein HOV66_12200 [Streptomycetaceae bacterium]|nr:hypothetical protein [Streptomycetaceae bacterium]